MVNASHWVGLTLPGIIEEPGSFSGNSNSPMPHLGPDPINLMSLAIFIRLTAKVFSAPLVFTIASLDARASNLFGAVMNLYPVISLIFSANLTANPGALLSPVPTAVPP